MKHLLAISIGPVQDFIAAARRTADLAAGSDLLVEIAKATAKAVEAEGGTLIFPADSDSDGANKLLAELPDGAVPQAVGEAAKATAREFLRKEWNHAKQRLIAERYDLNEPLADEQIECFLEIYAAWTPLGDDADYGDMRRQVDGLLAARKGLRNFDPSPSGQAPKRIHAKSPLDPAFECALLEIPDADEQKGEPGYLRLRKTEYLDAISLLKRVKGRAESRNVPSTRDFARRRSISGFLKGDWSDEDNAPEPYPYLAILVADGDRMGELLSKTNTPDEHREFSRKLVAFSTLAKSIAEDQDHDGYCVYAGGDDVLALLPVPTAIDCARELAAAFPASLENPDATLSAGVAIVHYRQPLSLSLEAARGAERAAKDAGRNRLCLAIHPRGGNPLHVTQEWAKWGTFDKWIGDFNNGSLTRGVAYELRKLAEEFARVSTPPGLLQKEAERIWGRKHSENRGQTPPLPPHAAKDADTLKDFSDLLIAARFLTNKGE
jgi:CRISPR-associated protein Cmr2